MRLLSLTYKDRVGDNFANLYPLLDSTMCSSLGSANTKLGLLSKDTESKSDEDEADDSDIEVTNISVSSDSDSDK